MKQGNEQYFQHVRSELIEMIPHGEHRVLEVGCAQGATCKALKDAGCASEVVGIELVPEAAEEAAKRLDHVICGDLEKLDLLDSCLGEESFDYIICGDVLEHLRDPWLQLGRLLKLLKPGGRFITSLPNIRYYGVSLPLIFGDDWSYQESGILDSTHLRFFTRSTSMKMLSEKNLTEIECIPLIHRRRDKVFHKCSFGLLSGLVTPQWVLAGTKPES